MTHLLRTSTFAVGASLALTNVAYAQDVYNFYFQKSAAPSATVNGVPVDPQTAASSQGVTPAAASAVIAPVAPSSTITTSAPPPAKDDFRHWQANIAWGTIVDQAKQVNGLAFGGEYAFNKYLGLQGEIMTGKASKYWHENTESDAYNATRFAAALGAKLTPIHVQLFGWTFIEFSVLGGVMSATSREPSRHNDARVASYAGFGATLNLSESTTLITQYKFEDADPQYGHAVAGLGVRF